MQIACEYLARRNPDVVDVPFQQRLAREVEAAGFDFVLLADGYTGVSEESARIGHLEPSTNALLWAVPVMRATSTLGVVCTLHTSFFAPAQAASIGAHLDQISGGRWAWNVTTGFRDAEATLFGADAMADHDERYDVAEEVVEIAIRLWQGEDVRLAGRFTRCEGRLPGPLPVQRPYPPIINAGSSDRGKRLGARYCDYVFGPGPLYERAREVSAEIEAEARRFGRPSGPQLLLLLNSLLRDVPGEAAAEMARIDAAVASEQTMTAFVTSMAKGSESSAQELAKPTTAAAPAQRALVGTPSEVAEELIDGYHRVGLRGAMLTIPTWWPEDVRRYRQMFDALHRAGVWAPPSERGSTW